MRSRSQYYASSPRSSLCSAEPGRNLERRQAWPSRHSSGERLTPHVKINRLERRSYQPEVRLNSCAMIPPPSGVISQIGIATHAADDEVRLRGGDISSIRLTSIVHQFSLAQHGTK